VNEAATRRAVTVAGVAGGVGTTTIARALAGVDRGVFTGRPVDVLVCRATADSLLRAARAAYLISTQQHRRPVLAVNTADAAGPSDVAAVRRSHPLVTSHGHDHAHATPDTVRPHTRRPARAAPPQAAGLPSSACVPNPPPIATCPDARSRSLCSLGFRAVQGGSACGNRTVGVQVSAAPSLACCPLRLPAAFFGCAGCSARVGVCGRFSFSGARAAPCPPSRPPRCVLRRPLRSGPAPGGRPAPSQSVGPRPFPPSGRPLRSAGGSRPPRGRKARPHPLCIDRQGSALHPNKASHALASQCR